MGEYVFHSKARVAISPECNLKCFYCDYSRRQGQDRIVAMEDYRSTPLSKGVISSDDYIVIMEALLRNGFNRVDFTGGEPMLNKDWKKLVCAAKHMGFQSVEMTTNGTLISNYLRHNGSFPLELDRLIVSLDTYDVNVFKRIIGRDFSPNHVVSGVKRLRETNPRIKLTANCVLCKDTLVNIEEYLAFIKGIGFDGITFLDLVVRDVTKNQEVDFFINEFVSGEILKEYIRNKYDDLQVFEDRHSYNVVLPDGLVVGLSDTKGFTRRDQFCEACPDYCQEGLYTIRVATDGTISDCLGPKGFHFDGINSIKKHSLDGDIGQIYRRLANSKVGYHFDDFLDSLSGGQDG